MNDIARIESAISFIPAIDRSLWVEAGMAVKSELGEAGRDIWDAWSRGAESYKPESANAVWRSIKPAGKITVATLYHHARANGWRDDAEPIRLSAQQIAERKRVAMERASEADRVAEICYRKAAARAATLIKTCGIGTHPYLAEKGFAETRALVTEEGSLVIPMRDCVSDALTSAQIIRLVNNKWEKKNLPDGRARGALLRIGNPRASEAWLVEGYATGLSVDAALKLLRLSASVLVCFSAHNLAIVARSISGKRFVFADNDESRTGEHAAWDTGLPYAMADRPADRKKMDANDLHQSDGLMAVAKKIMEARSRMKNFIPPWE